MLGATAAPPHFPLVRRIIRLIDRELGERGLPEMFRQSRRLQVDLATGDLPGQQTVELGQRSPRAQQSCEPRGFRIIAALRKRQLPRYQLEDVDGDAQLERIVARDAGRDV